MNLRYYCICNMFLKYDTGITTNILLDITLT